MAANKLLQELGRPFAPAHISWLPGSTTKDGKRCMAMAYGDTRAYQDRLDDVLGLAWQVRYRQTSPTTVVCELTLHVDDTNYVRSATGEDTDLMSAEARAFKRACSAFNLGRYLYDLPAVWVEYDAQRKRISDSGQAQLNQRYRDWYQRITGQPVEKAPPAKQTTPAPTVFICLDDDPNHGPWHEEWTEAKDYPAAMEWARKSGKFNHERHLTAAWGKVFAQHEAHQPENAAEFLHAWYIYVMAHDPAPAQHVNGKVPA